jgi:hypothetical protein
MKGAAMLLNMLQYYNHSKEDENQPVAKENSYRLWPPFISVLPTSLIRFSLTS